MKFKEFINQRANKDKWSDDPDEELSLTGGAADPHVPQHYGAPLEPDNADRWLKQQKQQPQQKLQPQQPTSGYDLSGAEEWEQKQNPNPTGTWDKFKTMTKATDDDNGIRALYSLYGDGWDSEDVIKRANAAPTN